MGRAAGSEPKRKPGRAPVWLSTRDRVVELPLLPIGLILLCLSIVAVQKIRPDWGEAVRLSLTDSATPVLNWLARPVDNAFGWVDQFSDLWHIHEENQRLKVENDRLRQWQQVAAQLEMENRALGALLGYHAPATNTVAVARVVADQSSFFNRSVLAALGQQEEIRKNQPVIDDRGLVGRVQEIGQHSARILLVTDRTSRIPVLIERTALQAIAIGTNSDFLDLDFADDQANIVVGDRLLTSGTGGVFPAGLLLGVVTSIEKDGPHIKPAAGLERLMMVRVLTSGDVVDPREDPPSTPLLPGAVSPGQVIPETVPEKHPVPPVPSRRPSVPGERP